MDVNKAKEEAAKVEVPKEQTASPAQTPTQKPGQAPKMSKEELETAKRLYEEEQESLAKAISESQAQDLSLIHI